MAVAMQADPMLLLMPALGLETMSSLAVATTTMDITTLVLGATPTLGLKTMSTLATTLAATLAAAAAQTVALATPSLWALAQLLEASLTDPLQEQVPYLLMCTVNHHP